MKRRGNKSKLIEFVSKKRFWFLLVFGITIYWITSRYQLSLWWVLAFGTLTGIIWGKVFCRWICPLGILMELFMKINPSDSFRNMYQYHKIGCPIAWVSGFFNRLSLYRIQLNIETCSSCGICDKACYMPTLDKQRFSLYKKGKENPALNYSCSKCLNCVAECPNGSLTYKPFINI